MAKSIHLAIGLTLIALLLAPMILGALEHPAALAAAALMWPPAAFGFAALLRHINPDPAS